MRNQQLQSDVAGYIIVRKAVGVNCVICTMQLIAHASISTIKKIHIHSVLVKYHYVLTGHMFTEWTNEHEKELNEEEIYGCM